MQKLASVRPHHTVKAFFFFNFIFFLLDLFLTCH